MTMQTRNPVSIQELPDEILADIFTYLDAPPPSPGRLNEEPHFELTDSNIQSLKSISQVSSRWRQIVLPLLFRHVRLQIRANRVSFLQCSTIHELFKALEEFLIQRSLAPVVKSFALCVENGEYIPASQDRYAILDFAKFWDDLFQICDPTDVLIVAQPMMLGLLCGCRVPMQDDPVIGCSYHYLYLQRENPGPSFCSSSAANAVPALSISNSQTDSSQNPSTGHSDGTSTRTTKPTAQIFAIRPWTKLLLNEGSFIKAFSVEYYWMREPPSILNYLLGSSVFTYPGNLPPTVRTLSYIGIFPMSSHFSILAHNMPLLDHLYVQLTPRSDSILSDPSRIENVEITDLWRERNSCYALLMRELFRETPTGHYKSLKVFESGDAADRDSWELAVRFVQTLASGWKVAGDGVFVKDTKEEEEDDEQSPLSVN